MDLDQIHYWRFYCHYSYGRETPCCTEVVACCMHGSGCNGKANLSLGTGIGFLNHHVKKGSKMVVMMDLDQNLSPSTASFGASFCLHQFHWLNVGVMHDHYDYHCHLRGEGGGVFIKELHDSHVGHACMTAMSPQFAYYILNRKFQPDSNVLWIHSTGHERKPRLHDGLVRMRTIPDGRV